MSYQFWQHSTGQDFQNYHGPTSSNYWSPHSYQANDDFEQQCQVPYLEHPADQWCSSSQHIDHRWDDPRIHHSHQFQQPMFHQQWENPRSSYFHQEEDQWSTYPSQYHAYEATFPTRQALSIQDSHINSDLPCSSSMHNQDLCCIATAIREMHLDLKQSHLDLKQSFVEEFRNMHSTFDKIDSPMEKINSMMRQITLDLNEMIARGLEDEEGEPQNWPSSADIKKKGTIVDEEGEGTENAYQPDSDTEQPDWASLANNAAQHSSLTNPILPLSTSYDEQQTDDAQALSLEIISESNSNQSMVTFNSLNSCFNTNACSISCESRLDTNSKEKSIPFEPSKYGLESDDIEHDDRHVYTLADLDSEAEDLEDNWRTTKGKDVHVTTTSSNTSGRLILDLADLDSDDEDMIEEWKAIIAQRFPATTTLSHISVGEDHSFSSYLQPAPPCVEQPMKASEESVKQEKVVESDTIMAASPIEVDVVEEDTIELFSSPEEEASRLAPQYFSFEHPSIFQSNLDQIGPIQPAQQSISIGAHISEHDLGHHGDDEESITLESHDHDKELATLEDHGNNEVSTHMDPDFIGIEAALQKDNSYVFQDHLFATFHPCTSVTDFIFYKIWKHATYVCHKTLLHIPLTSTMMALSTLAFHGILSHHFCSFILASLHIIVPYFPYLFEFVSYLIFALRWQDPP